MAALVDQGARRIRLTLKYRRLDDRRGSLAVLLVTSRRYALGGRLVEDVDEAKCELQAWFTCMLRMEPQDGRWRRGSVC